MSRGFFSKGVAYGADVLIPVGTGQVPTVDHNTLQAQTRDLDTAGQDMIDWALTYIWPSDAGEAMSMVSDNALDNALVLVSGLDLDFKTKNVVLPLDGLTPVSIGIFTRVNVVTTIGTTPTVGMVSVTGNGNTYGQMDPGKQISSMGVYTSPAGKLSQILSISSSMVKAGSNADASLEAGLYFRAPNSVFKWAVGWSLQRRGSTTISVKNEIPRAIEGPVDHIIKVIPSANGMMLGIRMALLLQDVK